MSVCWICDGDEPHHTDDCKLDAALQDTSHLDLMDETLRRLVGDAETTHAVLTNYGVPIINDDGSKMSTVDRIAKVIEAGHTALTKHGVPTTDDDGVEMSLTDRITVVLKLVLDPK